MNFASWKEDLAINFPSARNRIQTHPISIDNAFSSFAFITAEDIQGLIENSCIDHCSFLWNQTFCEKSIKRLWKKLWNIDSSFPLARRDNRKIFSPFARMKIIKSSGCFYFFFVASRSELFLQNKSIHAGFKPLQLKAAIQKIQFSLPPSNRNGKIYFYRTNSILFSLGMREIQQNKCKLKVNEVD